MSFFVCVCLKWLFADLEYSLRTIERLDHHWGMYDNFRKYMDWDSLREHADLAIHLY